MRRWLYEDGASVGVVRHATSLARRRSGHSFPIKCSDGLTSGDLELGVALASAEERRLLKKRVSPDTLRHTSAMHPLQLDVPFNVIALWLGQESTTTTHRYVEADLAMKEKALARLDAPNIKMLRYRAPDSLMRFLQTL